jgi:opacity protein-like surface antigen
MLESAVGMPRVEADCCRRFTGVDGIMLRLIIGALLTAALATASAVPAMAVDLLPPPEPAAVGCFYARLDGGGAFYNRPTVFRNLPQDYDLERGFGSGTGEALNEELDDTGFIEGGLGCQVNDLLRVDATAGYRFRQSLTDGNDTLNAELQTVTVFANAYWDITNYGGFTPYVGGGVGAAFHRLSDIAAPLDASDGDNTSFAWNVTAGVSYDLSPELKIDVSYRYTDLGSAISGGSVPLDVDDLTANEIKIGLRYYFW